MAPNCLVSGNPPSAGECWRSLCHTFDDESLSRYLNGQDRLCCHLAYNRIRDRSLIPPWMDGILWLYDRSPVPPLIAVLRDILDNKLDNMDSKELELLAFGKENDILSHLAYLRLLGITESYALAFSDCYALPDGKEELP